MISTRRGFLRGLGAVLVTAPAIVHVGNLMPVRPFVFSETFPETLVDLQAEINTLTSERLRAIVDAMRNMPQWPIYRGNYIIPVHPSLILALGDDT